MKWTVLAGLTLGLMSCLSPWAMAKSYNAIVTGVYEGGSSIKASVTDEYGKTENDIMFHLLPDVDLSDYKKMGKINAGDRVMIEAESNADGHWQISRMVSK